MAVSGVAVNAPLRRARGDLWPPWTRQGGHSPTGGVLGGHCSTGGVLGGHCSTGALGESIGPAGMPAAAGVLRVV